MYSCTAVDCLHDSSNLPPYNTLRALRRKSVRRARIEFGLTRGGTSPIFWNWPELLGIEFRSENQVQIAALGHRRWGPSACRNLGTCRVSPPAQKLAAVDDRSPRLPQENDTRDVADRSR